MLIASAAAQVTVDTVQLGGFGTVGSEGGNPPTLSNNTTVATGLLTFTYDSSTARLSVRVDNTTPDVAGEPNALITSLYFNVPHFAVTGMTLVSQTAGPNGLQPNFSFVFDPDVSNAPNPNGADGLGAYSVGLYRPSGPVVGIANPAASSWVQPLSQLYEGPAVFDFNCTGPTTANLTAENFAKALSYIPPGQRVCQAAGHFQAGGAGGSYSGYIGTTSDCVAGMWIVGNTCLGNTFSIVMSAQPNCHGCLVAGLVPGPTLIGGVMAPFAPPYFVLASQTPVVNSFVVTTITVPTDPLFVGMNVYVAVVLFDMSGIVPPVFTPMQTITICP